MRLPFASRSFRPLCLLPHALSLQGVRGHGALAKEKLGEQSSGHNRGTAWRRAEALLRGSPWKCPDSIPLAKPQHEPFVYEPPRLSLSRGLGQPDIESDQPNSRTRPPARLATEHAEACPPDGHQAGGLARLSDSSPLCPDPRTRHHHNGSPSNVVSGGT